MTQNLVPNPSFEKVKKIDHRWCGNNIRFDNKMHDWTSPTQASPDLLFDKYLGQMYPKRPNVSLANCKPHSGRLMVGIKTFGCDFQRLHCKEYLQVRLKKKCLKGQCFRYEFWTSTISTSVRANNLGIGLSKIKIYQDVKNPVLELEEKYADQRILGIKPNEWYKVEGEFEAQDDFEYLLIGNFFSDRETKANQETSTLGYSYYLIDDVSLYGLDCQSGKIIDLKSLILGNILFDFDGWTLKNEGKEQIRLFLKDLESIEINSIAVTGHTDTAGSDRYNLTLSQRRAESVKNFLVGLGIADAIIEVRAKGSAQLVDEGLSPRNRRVEIAVN